MGAVDGSADGVVCLVTELMKGGGSRALPFTVPQVPENVFFTPLFWGGGLISPD